MVWERKPLECSGHLPSVTGVCHCCLGIDSKFNTVYVKGV